MKIHFICIGEKMPAWVTQGYQEYAKRLPAQFSLNLIEIPLPKRSKQSVTSKLKKLEAELIKKAIPQGSIVIALEVTGKNLTTEKLADKLQQYHDQSQNICLIVGGPDGIDKDLLALCEWQWSLSALTLPHPLVRVVVAEQVYRAWSLITNHPYHR